MQYDVVGELRDNSVIINDQKQGSRLYNRGYYGTPQSGGGFKLELIEAFYLLDDEKIRIFKGKIQLKLQEFLGYITNHEPTFEIKYIVYRDLRTRGLVVKPSNLLDFEIYETETNGSGAGKRSIKYWCLAVSERAPVRIQNISDHIKTANNTRKQLLIAVVDEEGDITYYTVSHAQPKGKRKSTKFHDKFTGKALLVEDRVMLWDLELISELRESGFYGKPVGSSLQLALTESAYLIDQGVLSLSLAKTKRKLTYKQFMRIARKIQPDIDLRLKVYKELKAQNLIVKTGFKYGSHFRVYEGDPNSDHSEYLVHSIPTDFETSWEELSRAVRLAQGVRKRMLFARENLIDVKGIEYINIERIKP